jgi:hypothetical protein
MDHQDGLQARLTGAGCTACGAPVPQDRIAVLADRGDLAFLEIRCEACGSATLGLVLSGPPAEGNLAVVDTPWNPELGPADEARLGGVPPITLTDVVRMQRFLAAWTGDLRSLVDDGGRPGPGAG